MRWLDVLFGSGPPITAVQELARTLLIFSYGLIALRISGRRTFGKWSAIDIVVSIMVGSNLSRALTGGAPLWGTLAATTLLLALHWFLARAAARWSAASRLLEGPAITLGEGGKLDSKRQKENAISEADLNEALRQSGISDPAAARRLTLEPSGRITVLKGD